jgi:MtN3 and saliva related transmembrane protein
VGTMQAAGACRNRKPGPFRAKEHACASAALSAMRSRLHPATDELKMIAPDWVGSIAAALTTVAFVPQVWQIIRTHHTHDISLGMYAIFTAGVAMWLVYGILLGAWPIVIANGITLLLAGTVLVMKIRLG